MIENRRILNRFFSPCKLTAKKHGLLHTFTPFITCELLNISAGGLGLSSHYLNIPMTHKIDIHLAKGLQKFKATGLVCHHEMSDSSNYYGILFISLDTQLQHHLKQLEEETYNAQQLGATKINHVISDAYQQLSKEPSEHSLKQQIKRKKYKRNSYGYY
jgi:hypothetical protein